MAKIHFNKQNEVEISTILLQNRNFDTLGKIRCTSDLDYKDNFNSANELSFQVYKTLNGADDPLWDKIVDCKIIYIPEIQEKFEIKITYTSETKKYKTITGTSLAETELSQVSLYDIEINTTDDIARPAYDSNFPTVFYRIPTISLYDSIWAQSKYVNYTDAEKLSVIVGSSLLNRLLEKANNYTITHVDSTLANLTKVATFSISDTDVYSELTGEISDEYGSLFLFDSINRTVSAYDLYNTCADCGYRGDFNGVCPVCGSTNFSGQYGKVTTINISDSNLATEIQKEGDIDSLKNTFRISGGDDIISAAISSINPNGTRYIYYFSPDVISDMPTTLVDKLDEYNTLYSEYQTTHEYSLNATNVTNYNSVISYILNYFPDSDYTTLSSPIVGYEDTTTLVYDTIDLQLFLQTSMMPTIVIDNPTIEETMALLVASNLSPIAVSSPSTTVLSIVNNAVLGMAKVLINTALYTVTIDSSDYTSGTIGTWVGKFKLVSIVDDTEILVGSEITLSITSDEETYIVQKINKLMAKSDINDALDLSNMDMTLETFTARLAYYGIDSLQSLITEFNSCIGIILEEKVNLDTTLYDNFYASYNNRVRALSTEIVARTLQLSYITTIYDEISSVRSAVQTALNLQSYLGTDLWRTFCSYRREDSYSNDNYISDGLTNAEIISRAKELFAVAQQELYKAGNIQYSMTTTMNNLLAMKEFLPIVDDFESGNWLNIQLDNSNYKLRLLSYEIKYDDLQTINVEFSTVSKVYNTISDIQSVLDSARSMSGSYSALTQQVSTSAETTSKVNDWVDNGLSTTTVKIVNDAHNATFITDVNGILGREFDNITQTYSPTQLKVLPSGVYITDDAWETVKAALGKYAYIDPLTGETKIAFGLLAETVVGKLILSEKNVITNGSDTVQIDNSGIRIYHGEDLVFSVDTSGNGMFKGEIHATSGYIGSSNAWTITDGLISGNSNSLIIGGILQSTNFTESDLAYDENGNLISGTVLDGTKIDLTNMTIKTPQITITKDHISCIGYTTFGKRTAGKTIGSLSHAEGYNVEASGSYSHVEGYATTASGRGSHAEGVLTTASGDGAHAEGVGSSADGDQSHAESGGVATGMGAHAEGDGEANGLDSHAEGYFTTASGQGSHAEGEVTIANGDYSHVQGRFNIADNSNLYAFIIGGGTESVRKNIFTVNWSGDTQCGKIYPLLNNIYSCGDSAHHYTSVYATNGTIQTSDRNKKNHIQEILPIYETMFMKTITVQYMLDGGDRIHFGVVSQDFEELLAELNLTDLDCAAFCKDIHYVYEKDKDGQDIESTKTPQLDENGEIVYDYAFRYSEFIMLTVHMVQKTILRVDKHDERLNDNDKEIIELQSTVESQKNEIILQQETLTNQQQDIKLLQEENIKLKESQETQAKLIQALCEKVGLDSTTII